MNVADQKFTSNTSTNARVFKGKEAIRKQFPWQILIHMKFKNVRGEEENTMSGGTLISRKHVLTAAHNFYDEEDMTKYIQCTYTLHSRTCFSDF